VGHASVSAPTKAQGNAVTMHIIGVVCAVAVPLLMLLKYLGSDGDDRSAWKLLERADIVALIFCVIAAALLIVSLLNHRRSLGIAAAALLFAVFGLLLTFPLEIPAQSDDVSVKLGGYLAPLFALIGAGAAVYAAELAPAGPGGRGALAGAGRGPDPSFTTPIGGNAPAPSGTPQAPAGGGGIAPGWYDDPHRQARLRYFDGQNWTEQTSN